MIESLFALLCAGGIYWLVPKSTWYKKSKVKKDWIKVMNLTKTKNSANETFEVKSVDLYKNDSIDINVTVPIGLTPENLNELERTLEFNFGGDININWDKYNGIVKVKINKDPNVKMENIRKKWSRILSDKNIRNKFKQYFEVTDVSINNNSQYILTVMSPITLSDESLLYFKSIIEQNLQEETIESFYSQSNDIFITISQNLKKDSQ